MRNILEGIMKFTMMSPRGHVAGSFDVDNVEAAVAIAEKTPWMEEVLDVQESGDPEYGTILVVPDEPTTEEEEL